jgi:amidophosphoribosyltransferase
MLGLLRHRGYDSWGVAEMIHAPNNTIVVQRGSGIPKVDENKKRHWLTCVVGHTRYTTQGSHDNLEEAQPLFNPSKTISLVHNGQVETANKNVSDTKYILNLIRQEFEDDWFTAFIHNEIIHASLEERFYDIMSVLKGSYACIVQIVGLGLFAFRDPRGIRPLVYQENRQCESGKEIRFASESCAFDKNTGPIYDVAPGEVLWVTLPGEVNRLHPIIEPRISPTPCLFEFIYLAHDDSYIDGISIREARRAMGELMVDKVKNSGLTIDIIVPIPHTPVLAGRVLANRLGVDFVDALEVYSKTAISIDTSRRESRTFILPTQTARESAVESKFFIKNKSIEQCRGRRILLLDDSIVRGTTLRHVVKLIQRIIQPAKLYVASLAPPIVSPNYYGIDIPSSCDLVASGCSNVAETVQSRIGGIDAPIIYQDLATIKTGLKNLSRGGVSGFEDSVFIEEPLKKSIGEILGEQF